MSKEFIMGYIRSVKLQIAIVKRAGDIRMLNLWEEELEKYENMLKELYP